MAVKASGSVTVASITDVASTTRWYLLQSSTLSAPSKPTASPPGGSWAATEPTYTEGSTNSLYTCDLTTFSDGTWAYSSVSLSSSYEAAKTAYNKALAAANAAATTDQHFWSDADGAHVSSTGDHDLTGANLMLTSTRLAFRNALAELFSIVVSGTQNAISMLGGLATIAARTWTYGTTTYTGITTQSADGVSMECDSPYDGEPTRVAVEKTSPSGEEGGCVDLSGQWLFVKDPSITTADAGYEAPMANLVSLVNLRVFTGSTIVTINSSGNAVLMSANAYQTQVGRAYAQEKDMVFVMNGDTNAGDTTITAGYWPSDGNIWIHCGQITSRQVRVNWMFVVAGV